MNRTIAGLVFVVIGLFIGIGPGQCQSEMGAGEPVFIDVPAAVPVGGPITGSVKVSDGQGGFITTDTVSITVDHTGWNPPAPAMGTINLNMSSTDITFMGAVILTATNTTIIPNMTDTLTLHVVGVSKIQYESGTTFVDMPADLSVPVGNSITLKAITSYGTTFPAGQPEWGGLAAGTTGDQATVTFNTVSQAVGDQLVTAKCGIQTPVQATLTAVQVAKLQVQQGSTWADITGPLAVPVGTSLTFQAVSAPTGATFPAGQPVWGGLATGTADQATVVFNTQSGVVGDKLVTVKCGTQTPVEADVTAYSLSIGVRRKGTVNAFNGIAEVAAGGLASVEHHADVQVQTMPAVQGVQVASPTITLGGGDMVNASLNPPNAVTTNAQGQADWDFKSSDMVQMPTLTVGNLSANIDQRWDDIADGTDFNSDAYFAFYTPANVTFKPSFLDGGQPTLITSHNIDFVVTSADVWVWDQSYQDYDFTPNDTFDDGFAWFYPLTAVDGGGGNYTSALTVEYNSTKILDTVYFQVRDENAWTP